MTKLLLFLMIVVIATGAIALVFFHFTSQQNNFPKVDETGSTQQGIQDVIHANNTFAFDLYKELNKPDEGNIFYSPYSISSALGMTYEGARGKTADEIQSVFHYPDTTILRPNFAAIYNDINNGAKDYELKTGNALWVQQGLPFLPDYINSIEKYYGGKAKSLDFVKDTEKSRQTINSFIEEQTNNKIKDLIPTGFLNGSTRLVLTNAIYFKGIWQWEFAPADTHEEDFKITPDKIVKTSMMKMNPGKTMFNYVDTQDVQMLELPYKGNKISMLVLLPKKDLSSIEPSLTAEKLNEYKSNMKETKLDTISLPRFEFDTKYFMRDNLSALGMPTAFSDQADFSGMTGNRDLFIGFVIHQAFIKVDEQGTEAAAATAVGMYRTTAIMPSNVFRADHPFIFIIQEKDTGNILFIGRVVNPES